MLVPTFIYRTSGLKSCPECSFWDGKEAENEFDLPEVPNPQCYNHTRCNCQIEIIYVDDGDDGSGTGGGSGGSGGGGNVGNEGDSCECYSYVRDEWGPYGVIDEEGFCDCSHVDEDSGDDSGDDDSGEEEGGTG